LPGRFERFTLENGINLYVQSTPKFKTTMIKVFLHQLLSPDNVTRTALVPFVLRRGTESFPTNRDLMRRLEELYGAHLATHILKIGERQIITFELEMANGKYLPGKTELLREGLAVLREVILEPVTENGGFKREYLRQEKDVLKRLIESLINDKMQYAMFRCFQEMCRGENYGLHKYGRVEDLEGIDAVGLYSYYRQLMRENPLDVYVIGDVAVDEIKEEVAEFFSFPRDRERKIPPPPVKREVTQVKEVIERKNVTQGKLCLGLRTNTSMRDEDYYPLVVANGILGGFTHSKLFQNVREKGNLAYYAFSRLESTKGLMLISSGIAVEKFNTALEVIMRQVESLKEGDFTDEELTFTQRGLINRLRETQDSMSQYINQYLEGVINGREESTEERVEFIKETKKEDIVKAARKICLDTIYFLRNGAGEKNTFLKEGLIFAYHQERCSLRGDLPRKTRDRT